MGVAVFSGMIGVTLFGIFLTPVFYILLRAATGYRPLRSHAPAAATVGSPPLQQDGTVVPERPHALLGDN
jgi:multidrug efflux pump